jgi:V/A-type H+-transporting ATPase subunit F
MINENIEIAAISIRDTVTLFNAVGIKTFQVKDAIEAERIIYRLVDNNCKLIYIAEELFLELDQVTEKYSSVPFPVIIPIPIAEVSLNIGQKKIKDNVEKAIGIDIL